MHTALLSALGGVYVVLWSSGWTVSRLAVDEVNVVTLLTLRYLIVFVVLLFFLVISGQWKTINQVNIRAHILIGILSHAIYLLAGVGAFELGATAALVAFITSLQTMIAAVLSHSITSEKVSLRQWQGLSIGLCAVLLLVSENYNQGVNGYALVLPFIAVFALSAGTLINRRIALEELSQKRKASPVTLILFLHCAGALSILVPMSLMGGPVELDFGVSQWLIILWLALAVSIGAYAVLLLLIRHISALHVSSLSYLIPPATMMQAFFVFGESISVVDIVALFIAALGVFLIFGKKRTTSRGLVKRRGTNTRVSTPLELDTVRGIKTFKIQYVDIEL